MSSLFKNRYPFNTPNYVDINVLHVIFSIVDGGHRAVIFDRFQGVKDEISDEGTHFLIPWVQRPIIFDIRSRPRNVPVTTGSKGMKNWHLYPL